ncbi:MAG: Type 1 glutamine amidotransferase-like domain-containing protein [Anaerolineae bacterium]
MPQQGPLRWLDGEGWLVMLGGGDWRRGTIDEVDARLLSVANLDRPMVVLVGEGDRSDAYGILEHYTLLGGPGGEAFTLADMSRAQLNTPEFLTLLQEAGILYLGGENPLPLVNNLYNTEALRYIVEGFSTLQGLTLIGSAAGAATLGRWVFTPEPPHQQAMGFGFLMNAVVVPHFTGTENSPILKALPKIDPELLGLGVPDDTALALGPQGQVEMWGESHVTAVVTAGDEAADQAEST